MRKLIEQVGKILQNKNELRVSYKPYTQLGTIRGSVKQPIEINDKSGEYKIICETCNGVYVWQSGRKISTRITEHYFLIVQGIQCTDLSSLRRSV